MIDVKNVYKSFAGKEVLKGVSCHIEQGEKVVMEVTLFVKGKDGKYERLDERHEQFVHSEEEIIKTLELVGFEILKVEGHLGADKNESDRICFVAKRK